MCPLNRPINLDEVLAAPSQIFPSAYFSLMPCLPPRLSLSLCSFSPPHFKMEKSCYNSCGRFPPRCAAEWRNIYTMGYGDESAQLWRRMTFTFPPFDEAFTHTNAQMQHKYVHTLLWLPKVVVFLPPSSSVCACGGECLAEVWF